MAFVNPSSSFRSLDKLYGDDGAVRVMALALSGVAADTPAVIIPDSSGYVATALAASLYGYIGIAPAEGVASGAVAQFQIGGYRAGIQCSAAQLTGVAGNNLMWTAGALAASTSAHIGNPLTGQIGVLTSTVSASTTANAFLTGLYATAK